MAKITRKKQEIFASNAGGSGVAEPGSTADGTTVYTTDLDVIQSPAFEEGLAAMIIAGTKRLPVYEEINAVYYTATRQLAYLFQEGLAEWDAGTTYYANSVVKKTGTYELYGSIINDNLNNALPAAVTDSNWKYLGDLSALASPGNFFNGGVSTGSANAQAITVTPSSFSLSIDGATVSCTAGFTNSTTTPTFAVNGTTATVVKKNGVSGLVALVAGDINAGDTIFLTRNITGSCYVLTETPPLGSVSRLNTDTTNFQASGSNLAFGTAPVLPAATTATTQALGTNNTTLATMAALFAAISNPNTAQTTPANPTGTSNTTAVMMGLAGAFTPTRSGTVMIVLSGNIYNSTGSGYGSVQLRTGTGAAPANAAALTGTQRGTTQKGAVNGAVPTAFSVQSIVTGLTLATAIWIDAAVAAVTTGTASIENVCISVFEIH